MDNFLIYLEARTKLYSALSNFFYKEPTKADYELIKQYAPVIKEIAAQAEVEIDDAYNKFMGFEWGEKTEDMLAREFATVYLVSDINARLKPIVPHESVYLSASGLTMQDERDNVMEKFYKQGFKKQEGFTEPEDHIKAELDFIAGMTSKLLVAIKEDKTEDAIANIEAQDEFLTEHLNRWYSKACTEIEARALSDYFKGVVVMTRQYLKADYMIFSEFKEAICASS